MTGTDKNLLLDALADKYFCNQAYGDIGGCMDIGFNSYFAEWLHPSFGTDPDPVLEKIRQIQQDQVIRFYHAWLNGLPPQSQTAKNLYEIL